MTQLIAEQHRFVSCRQPPGACHLPSVSCHLPSATCRLLPAFCLLLAFTFHASAATSRWTQQSSGTMAWLHSVFFLNQNKGWAVGSKGVFLTTVDGGKT